MQTKRRTKRNPKDNKGRLDSPENLPSRVASYRAAKNARA
ncbi:hypothetical protein A2U01_0118975, partial [Trifolium medium]|nr:hypothetical protein [Trifolium medium]